MLLKHETALIYIKAGLCHNLWAIQSSLSAIRDRVGAPIRGGPGEFVTHGDRRGRELEARSSAPPLAGPPRIGRREGARSGRNEW